MAEPSPEESNASFEDRVELVTEAVDLYQTYLLHYVNRMTNQWQDAENIVQELWKFVTIYFKDEQIKQLPLLRRKAYQLFIDHYRAIKRRPMVITDELPDKPSPKSAQEAYSHAEELRLRDVFYEQYPGIDLSPEQKNVLWLHARYGFTHKEISGMTGVASSTVGDWTKLARKRIAEYINRGGQAHG